MYFNILGMKCNSDNETDTDTRVKCYNCVYNNEIVINNIVSWQ